MTLVAMLTRSITASRSYTVDLLATIDEADWFAMPGGVTHVAWQVGHLAMAEYRLALERIRGRLDGDEELIGAEFLKTFGRGSVPVPERSAYPEPAVIRAVFDRVHERVMTGLAGQEDPTLSVPVEVPHRLCATKGEVLDWCARHEMFHAGQIALIRRQLGAPPVW